MAQAITTHRGASATITAELNAISSTLVFTSYEASRESGRGFIFIIDEWDAPIREARSDDEKWAYIAFLRSLFKNINFTGDVADAAYMTGILPLKRYKCDAPYSIPLCRWPEV